MVCLIPGNVSITGFVGSKDLEVYLAKINGSVDLSIIFRSVSQPSHLSYTLQYGFGSLMPSGNALGDFASPRTPRSIMEETLLFPTMYAVFKVGHNRKEINGLLYLMISFRLVRDFFTHASQLCVLLVSENRGDKPRSERTMKLSLCTVEQLFIS